MSLKKMLLLFAVASQGSLFAQKIPNDTISIQTLDPLVVTANKFPQKQSTTGKVITVIDKKTINQNAGKTVAQLLNEVAGITVNGALNNAGTNQTLFLRGASSGRTLILMDGIPVFDASQINNEFDLNQLSLNNVESIEVCKGPQSTLYGSDAVAGVVNIITVPQNVTKPLQGSFTNSFGSYGTLKSALQLYGKQGKWQYNTRISGMKTNGFSAAHDSVGNKNFDADAYKGTNAMASITYQANKNWQWRNFVHTNYYRSDADAAAFADKKNFYVKHRNTLLGTSIQNQTTKYKWQVNYQYNYQTRFFNDNADVVGATSFSTNSFQSKSHFAEAFGNIRLAKQWEVLVGVDYRHNTMRNNYSSMSVWGPFKSQFNDTSIQQLSAYSSLLFKSGKWHVELGGRWNNHSKYGNNSTFTF
ncbi:MAG: TonB-dependent receptor plug domain-containing protein, partial [Chitinophagaceae bacterium]